MKRKYQARLWLLALGTGGLNHRLHSGSIYSHGHPYQAPTNSSHFYRAAYRMRI